MGFLQTALKIGLAAFLFLAGSSPTLAQFDDANRFFNLPRYQPQPSTPQPRPRPAPSAPRYQPGMPIPNSYYYPEAREARPAPAYAAPEYQRPYTYERREAVRPAFEPERRIRREARRSDPVARTARVRPAQVTAPEKVATPEVEPSTHVVVFGDSLAEYVGVGLEEAFEEVADVDVIRKVRADSGLTRQDVYDWPKAIQDHLNGDGKTGFAVMMIGVNDRQAIREADVSHDPLSERWRELYRERVDAVVRVFTDRKIPLIWVGIPPMRNEKSSTEVIALNEIYRDSVRKAGGIYVDIWPGFVNDENRYSPVGPDLDGRVGRLRTSDGVHFTAAGSRKAAHFAEVELKRLIEAKGGIALAALPGGKPAAPDRAAEIERLIDAAVPDLPEPPGLPSLAAKPLAGPTVPLTRAEISPGGALVKERLRATGDAAQAVDRALRDGLPPNPRAGRADDFRWPRS